MTSPFLPATGPTSTGPTSPAPAAALDRGLAAGGDRAARPAFAGRHRRHDRAGLSGAGARTSPRHILSTFLPFQPVGISTEHIDYPGTLTLPTEVAIKDWMALGESVARAGIKKLVMVTSHGGNSAAMTWSRRICGPARDSRGHHGLGPLRRAGGIVFRGRTASRHSWRRGRNLDHAGAISGHVRKDAIADFRPTSIAMEQEFRWLSAHRPAPFAWQAQDLHTSGAAGDATKPPRRWANSCSITAPARSANCLPRSINST